MRSRLTHCWFTVGSLLTRRSLTVGSLPLIIGSLLAECHPHSILYTVHDTLFTIRAQVEILSQNHEREVDRKDAIIQMLDRDLEEADEQHQMVHIHSLSVCRVSAHSWRSLLAAPLLSAGALPLRGRVSLFVWSHCWVAEGVKKSSDECRRPHHSPAI